MELTNEEKLILDAQKKALNVLSEYLGEGYEITLYSLEEPYSIILALNSGNKSNTSASMPDLTLSLLEKIKNNEIANDSLIYFNRNSMGEPIKAMITAIRGYKNRVIGLLCINFYLNTPFTKIIGSYLPEHNASQKAPVIDDFSNRTDEVIIQAVQEATNKIERDINITAAEKNKAIVHQLHNNGIFQIKDAVIKVAELLNISKNTVYLHIRNYKNDGDKN